MAKPALVSEINPVPAKRGKPLRELRLVKVSDVADRERSDALNGRKEADPQGEDDDLWDNVPI